MKGLRSLLFVLGAIAVIFGIRAFQQELKKPAEGMVMVEMKDPMINEMGGVDGTTVMTEEEAMEAEEVEVPMDMEPMEEVKEEEIFTPLPFDGRLGKFIKKYGGVKVDLPAPWVKMYGVKKGVKINGDVYFEAKDGHFYVFHKGKLLIY